MEIILDTNAVSDFAEGNESLRRVLERYQNWCLPVIVLGEYRFGLQASRLRKEREKWLTKLEEEHFVLDIDAATARHYATIRSALKSAGTPIPENDVWIGALAHQYRLPIATRDRHFHSIDQVKIISW
ncbi:MAG: type II toxin-antitoxin system VapC family toxin [Verrucomicrobiota bacterium]